MQGINEIVRIASMFGSFPVVCRSITEAIGSMHGSKHLSAIIREREYSLEDKNTFDPDYFAAGSLQASTKQLALLAQSEEPRVRGRVAENPNCPPGLLAWLAQDLSAEVRLSVAYNPNVPEILLEWLVKDESPDVLFELAENYNLARTLLVRLSQNDNPYVAWRAKQTLDRSYPEEQKMTG